MTETIESRLLALAEKATPGPWRVKNNVCSQSVWAGFEKAVAAVYGPEYSAGKESKSNAAHIAACDPDTIAKAMRVVAAARSYHDHHIAVNDGLCDLCTAFLDFDGQN